MVLAGRLSNWIRGICQSELFLFYSRATLVETKNMRSVLLEASINAFGESPHPRHTMQFWQLITVNETILVTVFDLMVFAKGGVLDGGTQLWQKNKSKGRRPKKYVQVTAPITTTAVLSVPKHPA